MEPGERAGSLAASASPPSRSSATARRSTSCFSELAERFAERPGGYTRVVRLLAGVRPGRCRRAQSDHRIHRRTRSDPPNRAAARTGPRRRRRRRSAAVKSDPKSTYKIRGRADRLGPEKWPISGKNGPVRRAAQFVSLAGTRAGSVWAPVAKRPTLPWARDNSFERSVAEGNFAQHVRAGGIRFHAGHAPPLRGRRAPRLPHFAHLRIDQIAITFRADAAPRAARGGESLQAKLTPLRFESGSLVTRLPRQPHVDTRAALRGRAGDALHPHFLFASSGSSITPFREKLITVFHELHHISPAIRRRYSADG